MIQNPYVTEQEIREYCAKQGTGIERDYPCGYDPKTKTDPSEISAETVHIFMYWHRPWQMAYAIKTNMDLRDFDDWQRCQDLFGIDIPYSVEKAGDGYGIENLMCEYLYLFPIEIEFVPGVQDLISGAYKITHTLSTEDALRYLLFQKQNLDPKFVEKMDHAFKTKLGVDLAKMVERRIVTDDRI